MIPFDEDFDDEDRPKLPEGVTEEMVNALASDVVNALEKVGVYAQPPSAFDVAGDDLLLLMTFRVGELAFAKRVQDPVQDEVDKTFYQFEDDEVKQRADEIRRKFTGDDSQS